MAVTKEIAKREMEKGEAVQRALDAMDLDRIKAAGPGPILPQRAIEPGLKFDGDKLPMELIAPILLSGVAEVLAFGANKYSARNWEKGMSWSRVYGAMLRHMTAFWSGENLDKETGLPHLWHAACCCMFLMEFARKGTGTDDRPT